MKLIVVESPTKARHIRHLLGEGYQAEATMGHIREIPPDGLNIDVEHGFEPTYKISNGKADAVRTIRDIAKKAERIYLAADPDREGEAIANHVFDLLDASSRKKCQRITYTEITKKAIMDAIAKARDIDMNLVNAQKARQVLDRLIGYKCSPCAWRAVGKGTSAGRVQSIALKLICDRQKEIDDFKPVTYWLVDALLKCTNGSFWAKVLVPDNKENRFLDKSKATKAFEGIKKSTFDLANVEKTQRKNNPNPPFDTNSLQVAASSIMKWKADRTMSMAQKLFEAGKISYHRTDSFSIAQEAMDAVRGFVKSEHGDKYLPSKPNVYAKKSKVAAQEAHECIRPTHIEDEGFDIDDDEQKLYRLIRDRFIACQMAPMLVNAVTYTVKASCGEKLVATGQSIAFDGFSKVWKHIKIDEQTLPQAEKGEKLTLDDSKMTEKKTEPPDRYNDGSLVKKMEKEGVGRPSTWASIIRTLESKNYVSHDKTAIVPLPIGVNLNNFLSLAFKDFFMDIQFTAALEDELDNITQGKAKFVDVVSKVYDKLSDEIKDAKDVKRPEKGTGVKCPACKEGEITEKSGRFGMYFSCSRYPDCKVIYVKGDDGVFKPKEKKAPAKEVGRKCPKCGKSLVQRTSSFGAFVGCSGYPTCKFIEREEKDKGKKVGSPKEE